MITPTVGRKVWFFATGSQREPIDATVIKVWGKGADAAVNLDVVDPDTGAHRLESSVVVGEELTQHRHYRWMPYQLGQAKPEAASVAIADAFERSGQFGDGSTKG